MKTLFTNFPPQEFMRFRHYIDMVSNPNAFPYWFEALSEVGFKQPKTVYKMMSYEEFNKYSNFFCGEGTDLTNELENEIMLPLLSKLNVQKNVNMYFIKNGCYSNKFDFKTCLTNINELTDNFVNIQYNSLMRETEGYPFIVIREYIEPKMWFGEIYNGMPMRVEFRVFYDFETKDVMGVMNYWNYDYCKGHLTQKDDEIFKKASEKINAIFDLNKDYVSNYVKEKLKNVRHMRGQWSLDFMLNNSDIENDLYFIDAAIAQQSAYYEELPIAVRE